LCCKKKRKDDRREFGLPMRSSLLNTRLSVVRTVPDAAVLYELGAPLGSISPCAAPIAQAGKRCGGLVE
jgi:hypothetical protein